MSNSPKPGSFEDFLRWLVESRLTTGADLAPPSSDVLAAANLAWRETQSLRSAQREALGRHFGQGSYQEDLELMAAADLENGGHPLPRLRTPNGFVISALYGTNSLAGTAPIALLVECPVGDQSLKPLAAMPKLRELTLEDTKFTRAGRESLRKARPNLIVRD